MRQTVLTTSLLAAVVFQAGATLAAERSEVPIREVVLSDGARRYGVPIKVGNTTIEAGLDTGSTGLRILPGALADGDAKSSGMPDHYAYGAGTKVVGETGTATVTIGSVFSAIPVQLIRSVGCTDRVPHCPASRIPLSQFGIQGDGLPNEGFKAILGTNMDEAEIASPFPALGATRWIVELPRPGSAVPGKIILNPTDDEVKEFVMLPIVPNGRGDLHDAVRGCIINEGTNDKACGALVMDSGAPGIRVDGSKLGNQPWAQGSTADLAFYGSDKIAAMEKFSVGLRNHASRLVFESSTNSFSVIYAGLSPYFAFTVLYDPANHSVGLKPRPFQPDAPAGLLVQPTK